MQRRPSFSYELANSEGDGLLRQRKSTAAPQQRHPSNHHSTASYSPHSPPTDPLHTVHPSISAPQNQYSRTDVKRHAPPSPPLPGAPYTNGTYSSQGSRPASTFYDPTADHRDRRSGWDHEHQSSYSPVRTRVLDFPDQRDRTYERPLISPTTSYIRQRSPTYRIAPSYTSAAMSQSPVSPTITHNYRHDTVTATAGVNGRLSPRDMPTRKADPMSFSSILSKSEPEPSGPPRFSIPTTPVQPKASAIPNGDHSRVKAETPPLNIEQIESPPPMKQMSPKRVEKGRAAEEVAIRPVEPAPKPKNRQTLLVKDIRAALDEIDTMELSDVEAPGYEEQMRKYKERSRKRTHSIESLEALKRKRRRIEYNVQAINMFDAPASAAKARYLDKIENDVWSEVASKEVEDEKERKKDMQRKRRREKTAQNQELKRNQALLKADAEPDEAMRTKYMKEADKAKRKIDDAQKALAGGEVSEEIREVTPHAPNMEGGTMSKFQMSDEAINEPLKKKGKTGTRLKKSKEQKQAEKDAAAAAHAAMEQGEELVPIAPKEEARLSLLNREESRVHEIAASNYEPYTSESYEQLYKQIWRDIARKDVPRVHKIKCNSMDTKLTNLRKTALLASKEGRRWQLKTNKSMKDVQARAKRSMREMLGYWKRNEREERDQRKYAERQELENAKKAEADREANRQKRKLNFLISQTELYSHFIGKKVRTDDIERSSNDVAVSSETIKPAPAGAHAISLTESVRKPKVTNFEDLDFDAEDETALHEAAMANAQNAVQEAQDRARAFNEDRQLQSSFDEGEMNFQNPTSLQSMDIAQPKMLSCQLKEYQLKGLNWLVNLYEQGINGILADEMGLGKTVQSISVMAYLAEVHNIWGPFLVIAPSSTLHNWQQEVARFVPDIKVLPYWGNAKDRKVLRKFWDRKHITYRRDSPFHVLVTSYQLVVQDTAYFQKVKWQYMILDEAQAIKSSQSSRWKSLLGFHCRNRLLLTGTPIQNNMQELWALLHFIMPSLFDSHDEFSDWFSKDIESHAQSHTKLNEDQLKRLHMILKPFMLRRIKKHVQKELGDKIEEDIFCDLTYRQRAYYSNLRNKISIMDLIEKAAIGDENDTATLMNLVMQFRKVCNHPDLFERADTTSPFSFSYFAETASFMREGHNVTLAYSVRNLIEYSIPRLIGRDGGRINIPGPDNQKAGWRNHFLYHLMNIWTPEHIQDSSRRDGAFRWLRFSDVSAQEAARAAHQDIIQRAVDLRQRSSYRSRLKVVFDGDHSEEFVPNHAIFNIVQNSEPKVIAEVTNEGHMYRLLNVSQNVMEGEGLSVIEPCARPAASAPPIELCCSSQGVIAEKQDDFFNARIRSALYSVTEGFEKALLDKKVDPALFPVTEMLPAPLSEKRRFTDIRVPSMRRFVTDSGKLAKLDQLLKQLKEGGHRVLLYFQMTRMIDLMEEYLTYRGYRYCRLDGSTKLEDRRDTVADFQTRPDIFIFLLSTRAGGLGINLTSADTVIFYDSDWNPTIDSQAMDRAHRLGQTKQVTVYRMITRGTIEERIRKRALQKEEVQRVVISGGAGAQVDFGRGSRENRAKDIAMWLADDDQAAEIEKKEKEIAEREGQEPQAGRKKKAAGKKGKEISLDDMYHEGEGHFDDGSAKPSGAATPVPSVAAPAATAKGKKPKGGLSKKAKTVQQRLAVADASGDLGMGGV